MNCSTLFAWITCFILLVPPGATSEESHQPSLRLAQELAAKYRQLDDEPERERLRKEIKELVEHSFRQRQESQRKQLEEMKEKLSTAERSLRQRAAIGDRIIERKVQDLLTDQPADWDRSSDASQAAFDVIGRGDTLVIYMDQILPLRVNGQPPPEIPINQLPGGELVTGVPLRVGSDGKIRLPMIGLFDVDGLTVRQAEDRIREEFVRQNIIRPSVPAPTVTLIQGGSGRSGDDQPSSSPPTGQRPTPGSSMLGNWTGEEREGSFDQTLGRLLEAKFAVREIESLRQRIEAGEQAVLAMRSQLETVSKELSGDDSPRKDAKIKSMKNGIAEKSQSLQITQDRLADKRYALGLKKEYLERIVSQLQIAVKSQEPAVKVAQEAVDGTSELHKIGAAPLSDLRTAEANLATMQGELQLASERFEQMVSVYDRWKKIVEPALDLQEQ